MKFDRENLGHRRLLALAIQDFLNQPGAKLSGESKGDGPSLVDELSKKKCAISRGVAARLADLNGTGERGEEYPRQDTASRVAETLESLGYWPAGQEMERSLRRLPAFYNGFQPGAVTLLKELEGTFVTYQFSNRIPSNILIGRLEIGALTPWHYAPATNLIEKSGSSAERILYEGQVWSDNLQNIYMLMRVPHYAFPHFILLEDIVRSKDDGSILAINGTGLGAGRQNHRHLTAMTLIRGPYPEDDQPIAPDHHARLPDKARAYLTMPLRNGPINF